MIMFGKEFCIFAGVLLGGVLLYFCCLESATIRQDYNDLDDHLEDADVSVPSTTERNHICPSECLQYRAKDTAWRAIRDARRDVLAKKTFFDRGFEVYPEWPCDEPLTRVGNSGDGGKIACLDQPDAYVASGGACLILSVGSNNDFSFEEDMHKRRPFCDIHTYDHTFEPKPERARQLKEELRVTYHPIGLSNVTEGKMQRLSDMLRDIPGNHSNHFHFAKIDCESCEHAVFHNDIFPALKAKKLSINQLLVEIHFKKAEGNDAPPRGLKKFLDAADDAGLRVVNNEFNRPGSGWDIWEYACEYTFVSAEEPASCGGCSLS